jgi:hypothetical protein
VVGIGAGALRLLLLAVLGIGVIGLHTIGHSADHHSWVAPSANGVSDVTGMVMVDRVRPPQTAMADTCGGDCGAHGSLSIWSASDSRPGPGGAELMTVCLAVLLGVGLLALLSRALARAGPVPRGARPGATRLQRTGLALASRFPLRLVDVAVLRT